MQTRNQGSSASLIELALVIVLIAIIVMAILLIVGDDLRLWVVNTVGRLSRNAVAGVRLQIPDPAGGLLMPGITRRMDWPERLTGAGQALLDLFFPRAARDAAAWEPLLRTRVRPGSSRRPTTCPRCGRPHETAELPQCRETPSHLDRIVSSAIFAHPLATPSTTQV